MERRNGPSDRDLYNADNYPLTGNPFGLEPVMPSVAPLTDEDGVIRSYYFDTAQPDSDVVLSDEFTLNE